MEPAVSFKKGGDTPMGAASCLILLALGLVNWMAMGCTLKKTEIQRQRKTMADMRTISIALDAYMRDQNGRLPRVQELLVSTNPNHARNAGADSRTWPPSAWPLPRESAIRFLRSSLSPRYLRDFPLQDSWGHAFHCAIREDLASYTLVSFGKDGIEDSSHTITFSPDELDRDLVLVDGQFVCFPEGSAM